MSDPSAFGFGQFVPGFDFLQNLSKSAGQAQPAAVGAMPGMSSWVAPTLSIEEIDKRIEELKSVLFWLEQNTTALKATIQAMEVQKMTLSTLQSMNVSMADLAKAFTVKPPAAKAVPAEVDKVVQKNSLFSSKPAPLSAASTESEPLSQNAPEADAVDAAAAKPVQEAPKPAVDPMQWWGALTQQFQGIAAAALKDVAGEAMKAGMVAKHAKTTAGGKAAGKRAKPRAKPAAGATPGAAPRKAAASKPTARQAVKTAAPRKAVKK